MKLLIKIQNQPIFKCTFGPLSNDICEGVEAVTCKRVYCFDLVRCSKTFQKRMNVFKKEGTQSKASCRSRALCFMNWVAQSKTNARNVGKLLWINNRMSVWRQIRLLAVTGLPSSGQSRTTFPPSARPRWRTRGLWIWRSKWASRTFTVTRETANTSSSSQTSGYRDFYSKLSCSLLHHCLCLASLWDWQQLNPRSHWLSMKLFHIHDVPYLHKVPFDSFVL